MKDMFREKPHVIQCLPAELKLTFDDYVPEDMAVNLADVQGCKLGKIHVGRTDGCYVYLNLTEDMAAKFCAGRYQIQIMDGCDLCDTLPIEFRSTCFVRSVEVADAANKTNNKKCC